MRQPHAHSQCRRPRWLSHTRSLWFAAQQPPCGTRQPARTLGGKAWPCGPQRSPRPLSWAPPSGQRSRGCSRSCPSCCGPRDGSVWRLGPGRPGRPVCRHGHLHAVLLRWVQGLSSSPPPLRVAEPERRRSAAGFRPAATPNPPPAHPLPCPALLPLSRPLPQWAWLPAPTAPWRGATTACWSRYRPA